MGWELLDSIILGCFVVIAGLLTEQVYRTWRARRDRYDLTPAGLAATDTPPVPLVDLDALRAAVEKEKEA